MMITIDNFERITKEFERLIKSIEFLQKETFMHSTITIEQYIVLDLIDSHSNCTTSELASIKNVKKSSITVIINRLSEKGFVEKKINKLDKRSSFLVLTINGMSVLKESRTKFVSLLSDYFDIDTDKFNECIRILEYLNRNFNEKGLDK